MRPFLFPSIVTLAACVLLAGCFRSESPLIAPGEGDFPFETMTYQQTDGGQEIKLVRTENGYTSTDEGAEERLLLKALGDNIYLAQVKASEGEGPGYLYGIVSFSKDANEFVVAAGYAEEADIGTIREGIEGLAVCADGADTVCIDSLDAYRAYAMRDDVAKRGTTYRILEMK